MGRKIAGKRNKVDITEQGRRDVFKPCAEDHRHICSVASNDDDRGVDGGGNAATRSDEGQECLSFARTPAFATIDL